MLRISAGIGDAVASYLPRSEMWAFIKLRTETGRQRGVDEGMRGVLGKLQMTIEMYGESENKKGLGDAVRKLREWSEICSGEPRTWKGLSCCPGSVSEECFELLAQRDDLALVVLIYWCVIIKNGSEKWFLKSYLSRTVELAKKRMEGKWGDVLEWPDAVMREL